MDHTCRNFRSIINLTEKKAEKLFEKEQQYSMKPVAFGKRSDGKRSDGKRSRRRAYGKKHINLRKYSRKI
jgi:hypothetical protein